MENDFIFSFYILFYVLSKTYKLKYWVKTKTLCYIIIAVIHTVNNLKKRPIAKHSKNWKKSKFSVVAGKF